MKVKKDVLVSGSGGRGFDCHPGEALLSSRSPSFHHQNQMWSLMIVDVDATLNKLTKKKKKIRRM